MRLVRSLHLAAIAAFALAIIAMVLRQHLVATILFVIACYSRHRLPGDPYPPEKALSPDLAASLRHLL